MSVSLSVCQSVSRSVSQSASQKEGKNTNDLNEQNDTRKMSCHLWCVAVKHNTVHTVTNVRDVWLYCTVMCGCTVLYSRVKYVTSLPVTLRTTLLPLSQHICPYILWCMQQVAAKRPYGCKVPRYRSSVAGRKKLELTAKFVWDLK